MSNTQILIMFAFVALVAVIGVVMTPRCSPGEVLVRGAFSYVCVAGRR